MQPGASSLFAFSSTDPARSFKRSGHDLTSHADADSIRQCVRALIDPLSVVVGFADLLNEGDADHEDRERYARQIGEAARELEQRVRRLEAITRDEDEQGGQLALF